MPEPDFRAFRGTVEAASDPPDFTAVAARARRAKLRDRLTTVAALVTTLLVFGPIAGVAIRGSRLGGQASSETSPPPSPPASPAPGRPISVSLRAVAGTGVNQLFAAVDVCTADEGTRHCSLQVTRLPLGGADGRQGPLVVGQLRDDPAAALNDVRLVPLSPRTLMLSGVAGTGYRAYIRINTSGGASELPVPTQNLSAGPADRPVQLRERGDLFLVRQSDDRIVRLANQPPVGLPLLSTTIAPEHGWWVVGTDLETRETTVAVSRNWGASWTVHRLGIAPAINRRPTLVSRDGTTAYLFSEGPDGVVTQHRTADGGHTWARVPAELPWSGPSNGTHPADGDDHHFGAWVRPDGSVALWLDGSPSPAFLESSDGGRTYTQTTGPVAPVITVPDGYVAFDQQAFVSWDGRSWALVPTPPYVPVS